MKSLVLVLGTGRSGTSTVARILHTKLGVCMGHILGEGNAGNPKGFFEDQETWQHNLDLLHGSIDSNGWRGLVDAHHETRLCMRTIGVKDPRLSMMSPWMLQDVAPLLTVFCSRPKEATVASFMKTTKIGREHAIQMYDCRARSLRVLHERQVGKFVTIDFSKELPELHVESVLQCALEYAKKQKGVA